LADPDTFQHKRDMMLTKVVVSISLAAVAVTTAACGSSDNPAPSDGCVGHQCIKGDIAVTDAEGGNVIFEYIYFDTQLQGAFKLPAGVTTVNRVMAYFMNSQTPQANPLPTAGQCNNLVTTKGWPETVGSPHTDLDVGTLTISGKNAAGTDVMTTVPKLTGMTDQIGRAHDTFYQIVQPNADAFIKPNSSYSVKFGGSATIPATTLPDALFLADTFTVKNPGLEDNGPLVAGTDFPVEWNPATSSNLPPAGQLVGGAVLGITWLVDVTGAPTHLCPVAHADGKFTIPGKAIQEYKDAAMARGQDPTHMILLRNAVVHQLVKLPNGAANNPRRVDMLTLLCWAQLMDVQ
jgi:hypothetical protein